MSRTWTHSPGLSEEASPDPRGRAQVGKRPSSVEDRRVSIEYVTKEIPAPPCPDEENGDLPGRTTSENPETTPKMILITINTVKNGFSHDLLYFQGSIADKPVHVLVDGGSIGNFISSDAA